MRWRNLLIAIGLSLLGVAAWTALCAITNMPSPWAGIGGMVFGSLTTNLAIHWYLSQRWTKKKPTASAAPTLARQDPNNNPRCACCKETLRDPFTGRFKCGCGWSAADLLENRTDDYTCTKHKRPQ